MTKSEFEDLLGKAGVVARDRDFFLIGSQSIRGVCPVIPRDFPKTFEADLHPRHHPQAWAVAPAQRLELSKLVKELIAERRANRQTSGRKKRIK